MPQHHRISSENMKQVSQHLAYTVSVNLLWGCVFQYCFLKFRGFRNWPSTIKKVHMVGISKFLDLEYLEFIEFGP